MLIDLPGRKEARRTLLCIDILQSPVGLFAAGLWSERSHGWNLLCIAKTRYTTVYTFRLELKKEGKKKARRCLIELTFFSCYVRESWRSNSQCSLQKAHKLLAFRAAPEEHTFNKCVQKLLTLQLIAGSHDSFELYEGKLPGSIKKDWHNNKINSNWCVGWQDTVLSCAVWVCIPMTWLCCLLLVGKSEVGNCKISNFCRPGFSISATQMQSLFWSVWGMLPP